MSTNKMDFGNIIRQVYEPSSESLNVNLVGSGSPTLPSTVRLSDGTGYLSSTVGIGYRSLDVSIKNIPEIVISHTDDSIRLGDGTNLVTVTQNGVKYGLDINIINSVLDVSDANALVELQNIDTKLPSGLSVVAGKLLVDGSGVTQPVSILTLPLPTGAATEAKQDSQITELTSIKNAVESIDLGIPASLGQLTKANSMSVTLASDQGNLPITLADEPIKMSGTIDGQPTGTEYTFVNNIKQQILAAHDRQVALTYADFGTKDERITQMDYTSATFPGVTARKSMSYTAVGSKYRRDNINWTIV